MERGKSKPLLMSSEKDFGGIGAVEIYTQNKWGHEFPHDSVTYMHWVVRITALATKLWLRSKGMDVCKSCLLSYSGTKNPFNSMNKSISLFPALCGPRNIQTWQGSLRWSIYCSFLSHLINKAKTQERLILDPT